MASEQRYLKTKIILIMLISQVFACEVKKVNLQDMEWLNEPKTWEIKNDTLIVVTDDKTDFWQETWYGFYVNTGHLYGMKLKDDFTLTVQVEAEFTTLYDQAGLMIYVDEKHWIKTGIEYNDGQPMIGSVHTNEVSDWTTGVYTGNPRRFWISLTRVGDVVCIKYSTDNITWILLRLCQFKATEVLVGPMTCSPQREGLEVTFSDFILSKPEGDILHNN